ncbi:MAG: hypothetical protein ROZ09_11660 [Thiobacillus sp.]|jgi:hypothetical protein|uniref:DUF7210 family protein n=1 Tax=Thiobacillus sp. TaxID=924 RepID=UPI002894ADA0|nr:hypothetical protein [Thiobacillus sp.]MDT3707476.1 hypothetical protein [Thiobacillus sp.]
MSKTKSKQSTQEQAAASEYTVLTPVEHGGKVYRANDTIELTDEQAAHPLEVKAIKPKAAQ